MSKGKTRALAARGPRLLRQILVGLLAPADVRRAYNRKESSALAPAFEGLARLWPCRPALAALYVGELLSDKDQEAFEIHFMSCLECVAEVELWRAVAGELRRVDLAQFATTADVLADLDQRLRGARQNSMRKAG